MTGYTDLQNKYLASLFAKIAAGKMDHSNAKGSIWLKATELQTVFGDDYKPEIEKLFLETDSNYYPPTEWSKGVCKAYKPRQYFYDVIEKILALPAVKRKLKSGVKYYPEKISLAKLNKAISSPDFFKNKEDRMMTLLYRKECDENGINMVSYRRTSGATGRRFAASISLQGLPGYVRRFIMEDVTDVDMCNAHPTLILSFMAKADEDNEMEYMNEYISSRDAVLQRVQDYYQVDRKAAKKLMLMVGYGATLESYDGAVKEWMEEYKAKYTIVDNKLIHMPFLLSYREELMAAKKAIMALPEASPFKMENDNRGFSLFIQMVEDEVLSICEAFFEYNNKIISCLLFDGFHVEGEVSKDEIKRLERCVREFLRNKYNIYCDLKFAAKYYEVN